MKIETDRATSTYVLGRITGLLMIALLTASGASYAQQASSPNSVLIELSPTTGEVLKVTKADGTPIQRVENRYPRSKRIGKGGKQFVLDRCMFCVPGNGCWQICQAP